LNTPKLLTSLLAVLLLAMQAGCDPPPTAKKDSGDESTKHAESADATQDNQPKEEAVLAEVGVGAKGAKTRRHAEGGGVGQMIAAPAASLFATREKMVFEISIPHAMNLYRASIGNFPKTHDEFMQKIIKANNIELPELPGGQRYEYNAESSQLMVIRPTKN
jgi:hypothetical protein